ncbi:MAG: DUF853 family protein [Desulfovibrionaceae bacterium]|nr:DUF853 family protein [Desulfovibrionaceae bacterium]
MLNIDKKALIGCAAEKDLFIFPQMANRHGLITGATGTGKTVTLQNMAETFSSMGVPVFMTDIKGDLSGICNPGFPTGKVAERIDALALREKGYVNQGYPVCFWDVFGAMGHPLRTTISDMGPLLLSRLLNLNEVQSGIMSLIFRIADDAGLLLLDMKDLRKMTQHVGENRAQYKNSYGNISTASVGAIQRALLQLEDQGGNYFFGEPAFDIRDLMRTDADGRGVVNILTADDLINSPRTYSTLLLWMLSELFEALPEAGDLEKPRLVFFFDEAHMLFNDAPEVLLEKIEQVVRLIRSKGVGVYFVTQNPADIPDSVLGQLGNRVQHALRAFTPREQKAVRVAAQSFRPNPAIDTAQAITELGVGEALVSFLDDKGAPQIVERALIAPPQGQVGPVAPERRAEIMRSSPMAGRYEQMVDRQSAFEVLTHYDMQQEQARALEQQRLEQEKAARAAQRSSRSRSNDDFSDLFGSVARQTTRSLGNTVGREIGRSLIRGLLGSIFGGRR